MNTQTLEVIAPEQEEIQNESAQYPVKATELAQAVKDDESYKNAADFLMTIKGFKKKVQESFGPVVQKANAAWKAAIDLRKLADDPLDRAERIIKPALVAYDMEQERKRRDEQDRLMAEQKKHDEDARLAQAEKMAETGESAAADAILEAPPAPIVAPAPPVAAKVSGITYSNRWKAEVTDLKALIKAIAEGKAPIALVMTNTTALNAVAKSLKNEVMYPGVRVWSERVASSRSI